MRLEADPPDFKPPARPVLKDAAEQARGPLCCLSTMRAASGESFRESQSAGIS